MKEFKIVETRSIVWVEPSDRYILIIRENDEITGVNYMQGDDIEYFKKQYNEPDPGLTRFVKVVLKNMSTTTEIDHIDSAIWAYFEYMDNF